MVDKISEFFFDILLPIIVGCGSLYLRSIVHGRAKAAATFILIPLFFICMYYLYKNTIELFKNLRDRK